MNKSILLLTAFLPTAFPRAWPGEAGSAQDLHLDGCQPGQRLTHRNSTSRPARTLTPGRTTPRARRRFTTPQNWIKP